MSNSERADVFVLAAPSGTGKTTLLRRLFAEAWPDEPPPEFSVSHTTRAPRPDERDGVNYHFVSAEEFSRMVEAGEFLEWAEVHGQLKGTSHVEIERRVRAGTDVLLDVDVQGVESVLAVFPDACSILILPPSYAELERRIVDRGHDGAHDVARRLAVSLSEIERYPMFDYVIVNDDAARACRQLIAILVAKRCGLRRNETQVGSVLNDFRAALDR